jgi:neural Wiskott-Aldrich syndrome protein
MLSRTSTSSSLSVADHSRRPIQSLLPTDSKIIATASAKVYHLPFGGRPENWAYSGLAGTLVFGRNRTTVHADRKLGTGPGTSFDQVFWFRLIDPVKGLVWMHEIPSSFDYALDKPFFHTFSGKVSECQSCDWLLFSLSYRAECLGFVLMMMRKRLGCLRKSPHMSN